jgi:putative oxidoreductase
MKGAETEDGRLRITVRNENPRPGEAAMLGRIFRPMRDMGPLVLRLAIGAVFLYHGGQKIGLVGDVGFSDAIAKAVGAAERSGFTFFPGKTAWGYALAFTEFGGGLLLVLGLFARYAAVALAFVMSIAIWKVHWPADWMADFEGVELQLCLLAGNLSLLMTGAGWLSVDQVLDRRRLG